MVLEIKVPHESDVAVLGPLIPVFLSYVLSFTFVGLLEQPSSPALCSPLVKGWMGRAETVAEWVYFRRI
jgi:hypothetical protein